MTHEEEFSVFNLADVLDIQDDGRFFGVLRDAEGDLRDLGTWQQQVAEFPLASGSAPWHGYPAWPLNDLAPPNRVSQKMRPNKSVFVFMESVGLISTRQRTRLMKGDHA